MTSMVGKMRLKQEETISVVICVILVVMEHGHLISAIAVVVVEEVIANRYLATMMKREVRMVATVMQSVFGRVHLTAASRPLKLGSFPISESLGRNSALRYAKNRDHRS